MNDLYLDHVLIAVHNLSRAASTFSKDLGFTLTPEGVHPGRGTHNRLIVFGPDYLELIAVRDPAEGVFRQSMSTLLAKREGLYMFALGTNDIDHAVTHLRRRGVSVGDPADGARQGGPGEPGYTWRSAAVPPEATPGSETFLIQHNSTAERRYTVPPDATRHPNGATGVHSLAIAVRDAETAAARWRDAFGFDATPPEDIPGERMRRVRMHLASCHLDFVSPAGPGDLSRFIERNGEAPYGLSLRVGDLTETAAVLKQRGIQSVRAAADSDGAGVTVGPELTHGVLVRFIQMTN